MNKVYTHRWQEQNLGQAPFRAVTVITLPSAGLAEANPAGYVNALRSAGEQAHGFGVALGTCYACGTALMNNVVIRGADGQHFVVGLDCARKTGDAELIAEAEFIERNRKRKVRRERAAIRAEAARLEREQKLQEQRERNGGLTDYELSERKRAEEQAAASAEITRVNAPIIAVLDTARGDFAASIAKQLHRSKLSDLSPRQIDAARDVFAKAHGRRGSKAYEAAISVFNNILWS